MRSAILAFVLGVWGLQQMPQLPALLWAILLPALLLPAWFLGRFPLLAAQLARRMLFLFACIGTGFFWAAGMAQWRLSDALPPAWEGQDIQVVGVVASLPQLQERGERFLLDVERVDTPHAKVPRRVSITRYFAGFREAPPDTVQGEFHAGERWRLTLRLKRSHGSYNPYGFDFEAWALERNIRATGYVHNDPDNVRLEALVWQPAYLLERLREHIRERFRQVLGDARYGGVLLALAIGDEGAIQAQDWQVFLRTGVNHLMSISGLHVTMVAALAFGLVYALWRRMEWLTLRLPARKAAALAGMLVAGAYALLAGFAVPTQRTFYMLAVIAAALWSGRVVSISLVLCWALLAVILLDPWAVLAPGFWLSFGAVALLVYAGSGRVARPHWLREAAHTQWVVTLGLTPLLLALFQQVSVISPLANAFAIPLISLAVTPLALLGAVVPLDAILLAAHGVMAACMALLEACARLPVAVWQQHAPSVWAVLLAMSGIAWMLLPRGFPLRWLGAAVLAPMFLLLPAPPLPGELRVAVLDVGQGLAVVAQTARHALLYDTGPRYSEEADSGNRIILPYLRGSGIGRLDGLIVSHDDNDHSGGTLSVVGTMPVGWVASSLPESHPLRAAFVHHVTCHAGQAWNWDGVRFEMLHPTLESYGIKKLKDNNRSCVLKISSANGSLLLPGDIERAAEAELLERMPEALAADLLVAAHHGSKSSSTPEFIASVNPRVTVFTAGYRNRFGHPKSEVVERYRSLGSILFRSDADGALLVDFTAGREMAVRAWRQVAPRYWQNVGNSPAGVDDAL
ncbi:MAG TPA: DNA internalization-related competence protein ComEC/Rec2 [Methylophilaceae bacterium]|nr:DNA internalization-related competence protein ComEC/Rec2 [Methylophilaceae bacterium]HQR60653.1 DNA internalization-related competence protein ComEC/Rec2 [Methylophilaceae bacterium]